MSVYLVKILELLSLDIEINQSVLRVRLSTEHDVELLWEIDQYTAEHLKELTVLGEQYKYRLSFHSSWDSNKNHYISFLTKTYKDQSEKIYFPCSEAYVNGLKAIKYNEHITQISIVTPLSETPSSIDLLETEVVAPKKFNRKFAWISLALMCVLTIISIDNSFLHKVEIKGITNVKSESIRKENIINVEETETIKSSSVEKTKPSNKSTTSVNESAIPIEELNEVINFNIQEGNVALTFDDGPSKFTKEITDILKTYEVGGTFFFIGNNVEKHPDSVQYVQANGYSIGNHSMSHPNFAKLPSVKQEYEILHTNRLIEELIQEKITLFRPPYGIKNETTIDLMNLTNSKMVLWNSDTEDWKSNNANEIFKKVVNTKASGSIILLHESQAVIDALPRIIEYLQGQDLNIVSLN
ncbi:polysaccharide deacetylase family protein [Psychrobacillus sp. FSL H8-0483]|uniref:polysaccharide deacetylase family protein n=1 Tax=Psychrobacillus sp. FSL H8-0483 TaxID=2921389 RepID=UPI00315A7662